MWPGVYPLPSKCDSLPSKCGNLTSECGSSPSNYVAFFQELLSGGVGGAPLPDVVSDKAVEFLALHAAGRVYGGPIVLTAEERAVTVKGTLVAKLNDQAVLMHFNNPGQAQLAELRGAVGR